MASPSRLDELLREARQSSRALFVAVRREAEKVALSDPGGEALDALLAAADYADDSLRDLIEVDHFLWVAYLRGLEEKK